jgi:uncharacterized cupredoxin-like copper-binding protein
MKRLSVLALISLTAMVTAMLALGACGGASSSSNTVTITLTDYHISASRTTFVAGTIYHFTVKNQSKSNHDFMIMPPLRGDMTMHAEPLEAVALYSISQPKLPPGATQEFNFAFLHAAAPGTLEFACHIGNQYQLGMHLPITVSAR